MARRASPVVDRCWTRRAGNAYLPAMRIACPNCAAEYEVPDVALAAGPRLLRCAKCSHQFTASLPAAPAAAPGPGADAPLPKPLPSDSAPAEAPPREPTTAAPKPRATPIVAPGATPASSGTDRVALFGWIATALVLLGGVGAVVTQHAAIAAAWPPAQRLFSALGLG